jgi:hypothetical protein
MRQRGSLPAPLDLLQPLELARREVVDVALDELGDKNGPVTRTGPGDVCQTRYS